jgi:tRNA(Ile2)-agmatinylcytidine synthase
MWIGVDDTDSPRGGCTTWIATELVRLARDRDLDLLEEPRLVRLNPNIPWKTRGNAALALHVGRGRGTGTVVGELDHRPIRAFPRGTSVSPSEVASFREAAWTRVQALAAKDPGTDPALVVTSRPLPAELYWRAVREVVAPEEVLAILRASNAWWRADGDHRGLVGASAAVSWPGVRRTWELTTYRGSERWGSRREVDPQSVRDAAREHPSLFLCDDPRTRRLLVAPHTDCPILFGLRSTARASLLTARLGVRSEPVERWILFRTNQATGDHLAARPAAKIGPYESARVRVTVSGPPRSAPGGHAYISVRDAAGDPLECVAFEPTKTLPRVVRSLACGDQLVLSGSRSEDPTFRLEAIRVVRLAPRFAAPRAPSCDRCGRRTRSMGRDRGYRCPVCRRRWPPEAARRARLRSPTIARVTHPTPSARRHLHPLAPDG